MKLKLIFIIALILAFSFMVSCYGSMRVIKDTLDIYFLDVGQGDAIFISSPNGFNLLIDTGIRSAYTKVSSFLDSLGIDSIDVAVATHPHADHIGSMASVISDYNVQNFYMPKLKSESAAYESMMRALKEMSLSPIYVTAETTSNIDFDPEVSVEVLSPHISGDYDEPNDSSIVLRVTYGSVSTLLTGDLESYGETVALALTDKALFNADILKVGHHGSSTSSSLNFLNAVSPRLAVISYGINNSYGHPDPETLDRLDLLNIPYISTADMGTIHIVIDGEDFIVAD
ncbi:MAG: MBL fold metallo-hydrolase [Clostridia bacterium]